MNGKKTTLRERLGAQLGLTMRALRQRLVRNLHEADCDLAAEHLVLLKIIDAHEGVSQQTLTEHVPHDKTAMTRLIDFLEESRLVQRISDRADRRQKMIFLTDRGREVIAKWTPLMVQTEQEALKGVSSQQARVFREVLAIIRRNLDQ